jgi:hypothetical protein
VIKGQINSLKLTELEEELEASATELPCWKLADRARRYLIDTRAHLAREVPAPSDPDEPWEKRDRDDLKKAAVLAVAAIIIRSVGAGLSSIARGHEPESAALLRRTLEAKMNAHAVMKDSSGEFAKRFLNGHVGSLTKLTQKYGTPSDAKSLSQFAHANVKGLSDLKAFDGGAVVAGEYNVMPSRNEYMAGFYLYAFAHEAMEMCGMLTETFGAFMEMPPWMKKEGERWGRKYVLALEMAGSQNSGHFVKPKAKKPERK